MEELDKIRYGALLHDVGKFAFRTHQKIKHELLAEIINQKYIKPEYATEIIGLFNPEDTGKGYHIRNILEIADWLAASERQKLTKEELTEDKEKELRDVIKKPLNSIFSEISLLDNSFINLEKKSYLPKILNLDSFFPANLTTEEVIDFYRNKGLWDKFVKDIEECDGSNEDYFNQLLYVFKKYFLMIPSAAYVDHANISLYDHIKTTIAIAESLFVQGIDVEKIRKNVSAHFMKNILKKNVEYDENLLKSKDLILVHADISGIQKFIYNIHTKSALKSLKGRSSFLSFLNEGIGYHFINKLNHTNANLLFQGGGHIYILTAQKNKRKIDEITNEINSILFSDFGISLFLAVGYTDLSYLDFLEDGFGKSLENGEEIGISKKWYEVSQKSNSKKTRKFNDLFSDDFFEPLNFHVKNLLPCSICTKDVSIDNDNLYVNEEGKWVDYVQTSMSPSKERYCNFCKDMVDLRKLFSLKEWQTRKIEKYFPKLELKNYQFNTFINSTENVPFKYFATQLPLVNNSLLTMDELGKKSVGMNKIAFLKMDVDNLGRIFVDGIKSKKSISKLSNLSTMISLFFEGYINDILKKYENKVYLVYSGGDDTFALGSWDAILDFSYDVYKAFREYTCFNPDITISAGIVVTSSHFPVSRGAILAEKALEKAKKYSGNNFDKNRICVLDTVFEWGYDGSSDFEKMIELKDKIVDLIKNKGVERSILQRTQDSIKGMKAVFKKLESDKLDVPAIWKLKYYVIRKYKLKDKPELFDFISYVDEMVKKKLDEVKQKKLGKKNTKYVNLDIIGTAVRIAEFQTRTKEEKNVKCE
jgi:CRISPR-associated protein Csm1